MHTLFHHIVQVFLDHDDLRVAIADGRVRVHSRCVQLRQQLDTGVYSKNDADYVRTDQTGHLDLIDALKYGVLNCWWKELLMSDKIMEPGPDQIVQDSPFARPTGFAAYVLNRPK
jgi:hypothetical protein